MEIAAVIGRYVPLTPSAEGSYRGRCPFHVGRGVTLIVFPPSQTWRCFGCDLGGDVEAFLARYEGA